MRRTGRVSSARLSGAVASEWLAIAARLSGHFEVLPRRNRRRSHFTARGSEAYVGAMNALLVWWMNHGTRETAEESPLAGAEGALL